MTERVFVTGATGVIGCRLVPDLVRLGLRVTAVGRTETKRRALERMGATAVRLPSDEHGRISRRVAARALAGHDAVVNLATHMPPSPTRMLLPWEWRENDRIRREDSVALVEAAIDAGVRRFVQESFAPVYAEGGDRWLDEGLALRPARTSKTLLDAERATARFSTSGGVGIVLRFGALYGPDAVLGEMIKVVRKGWSPLPGAPAAYWSSLAQDDAASATVAALRPRVQSGVYNIADDEPLCRAEWVAALALAIGAPMPKFMPAWVTRLGGSGMELLSRSQRISNESFKRASGWSPRWTSAREGLVDAVDRWLTTQPVREELRRSA
jgi:2-alkyl-3-oxoalkanoate reductase